MMVGVPTIFRRPKRQIASTVAQATRVFDCDTEPAFIAALAAASNYQNAISGVGARGMLIRITQAFKFARTYLLPAAAGGLWIDAPTRPTMGLTENVGILFNIQAQGVRLTNIVLNDSVALTTFIDASVRADRLYVANNDVTATTFFTLGALCERCAILMNEVRGGTIDTSGSNGSNRIALNDEAVIVSHASDSVGLNE